MASELARARLLWAILRLVLPVTFGHTTAYRSPALNFPAAAIHFILTDLKSSTTCSAVLCHSPSSRAAVVYWSALIPKALRSSGRHPIHYFPCSPGSRLPPPVLRKSPTLFGSLVSFMRTTKTREQDHIGKQQWYTHCTYFDFRQVVRWSLATQATNMFRSYIAARESRSSVDLSDHSIWGPRRPFNFFFKSLQTPESQEHIGGLK